MNRWVIVALVVSVTVNLVLAGFVVGRMSAGNAPMFGPPGGMLWMLRSLPDERRAELAPVLRRHGRALRAELRQLAAASAEMVTVLENPTLDETRLRSAAANVRTHMDAAQQHSLDAMIEVAVTLPAAERHQLAQRLRDLGRRGRGMRHRGAPPTPFGQHGSRRHFDDNPDHQQPDHQPPAPQPPE